jgi:hypothetical protein
MALHHFYRRKVVHIYDVERGWSGANEHFTKQNSNIDYRIYLYYFMLGECYATLRVFTKKTHFSGRLRIWEPIFSREHVVLARL